MSWKYVCIHLIYLRQEYVLCFHIYIYTYIYIFFFPLFERQKRISRKWKRKVSVPMTESNPKCQLEDLGIQSRCCRLESSLLLPWISIGARRWIWELHPSIAKCGKSILNHWMEWKFLRGRDREGMREREKERSNWMIHSPNAYQGKQWLHLGCVGFRSLNPGGLPNVGWSFESTALTSRVCIRRKVK